jgi:hypothetical protein
LQKLIQLHIIPLQDKIEETVMNQKEDQLNSLYSISELTLKLIVYNRDT